MSKVITISIDEKHNTMLEIITEKSNSDKSKMIRKFIRDNWNPEWELILQKRLNKK